MCGWLIFNQEESEEMLSYNYIYMSFAATNSSRTKLGHEIKATAF
jgi:hypothetical protein